MSDDKSNLELQFDSIVPDNLKANETISKLLGIYNAQFGGMDELLDNPLSILDTDYLITKYEETRNENFDEIRKELFKIHLEEIYKTFADISESEEIYDKFKEIYTALDIPTDQLKIVADIDRSINSEYINASSSFKTKKGTRSGFFFVYDIINRAGIQAINADEFFNLLEGTRENPNIPYEYTIETSLYKEVFQKTIVPLAHPVGFTWNFIRLLFLTMEDYYGLEQIRKIEDTLITCYGTADIVQTEIVNSGIYGTVKRFEISEDQDKQEGIVIDYEPLDGSNEEGLRLVKEYNGRIILYDRQVTKVIKNSEGVPTGQLQRLEIAGFRLVNPTDGILKLNWVNRDFMGETLRSIDSVDFTEYTIIDRELIDIQFRIHGDKPDVWNDCKLYLPAKTVSDDIKFFETVRFEREPIFEYCSYYNGRIVEDKGNNCLITYKATYTYIVSTDDVSVYTKEKRPYSLHLPTSTDDIDLSGAELTALEAGDRSVYDDKYATHDHTIQEFDLKDSHDNFGRLTIGNLPREYTPYKTQKDKIIGELDLIVDDNTVLDEDSDWVVNWGQLNIHDLGFNSNDNRYEHFFIPDARASLDIIGSTTPLSRYIRENLEWEGNLGSSTLPSNFGMGYLPDTLEDMDNLLAGITTLSEDYLGVIQLDGNGEYIAWEDFNMDVYFNPFARAKESVLDITNYLDIDHQTDGYKWDHGVLLVPVEADPVNLQVQTVEDYTFISTFPFSTENYNSTSSIGGLVSYEMEDYVMGLYLNWIEPVEVLTNPENESQPEGKDITDDKTVKTWDNVTKGTFLNKEFTDDMFDVTTDNIDVGDEYFYIGQMLVIKEYVDVEAYGEQRVYHIEDTEYKENSSFSCFSDEDDFTFGVYRDDELLLDNNVSSI